MNIELNNISQILTLAGARAKDGRRLLPDDLDIIQHGKIVFNQNEILFVGKASDQHHHKIDKVVDLIGHCVAPAYVDAHTHLVFGGDRSFEYVQKLNGESYQAIAAAGGGIVKTFHMTNNTTDDELFKSACARIDKIAALGIQTLEIKSGYSGTIDGEILLSKIIHRLKQKYHRKVSIFNTFMAAHAVPKEFGNSKNYMQQVVLPALEKLLPLKIIDAVDIFHEQNYFDDQDLAVLFSLAQKHHIATKLHADEFNDNAGAMLATKHNSLSADHLLCVSEQSIECLAKSKVVANLLPGTAFFLGKNQAPARKLLDAGVKVAIASDYNPGSCHFYNLPLIAAMAAPQYKMNIAELWASITLNAANALGCYDRGYIAAGAQPMINIFKCDRIEQISYAWGENLLVTNFSERFQSKA
jgi:imidazolonepropionase